MIPSFLRKADKISDNSEELALMTGELWKNEERKKLSKEFDVDRNKPAD